MANCCSTDLKIYRPHGDTNNEFTSLIRQRMKNIQYKKDSMDGTQPTMNTKKEILQNYKLIKKLGHGCFSNVYLAIDNQGQMIALKIIKKQKFKRQEEIEKIIIEKEILQIMDHPGILKLQRTMQTNTKIYLALEYAEYGNLLNLINKKKLNVTEIKCILAQLIEVLFYIHSKGIIYVDLKAENVLITSSGKLKLCDFNLSGTYSLIGENIQGTIKYLAPEIFKYKTTSTKSDFWALGVLLHVMFYRRFPFKYYGQEQFFFDLIHKNILPEPLDNQAPKDLRKLINDLLQKNPTKRIGDNINQFLSHPFFNNFDWKNYLNDQNNFTYMNKLQKAHDQGLTQLDEEISQINQSQSPSNFIYNIKGFSYENEKLKQLHNKDDFESDQNLSDSQLSKENSSTNVDTNEKSRNNSNQAKNQESFNKKNNKVSVKITSGHLNAKHNLNNFIQGNFNKTADKQNFVNLKFQELLAQYFEEIEKKIVDTIFFKGKKVTYKKKILKEIINEHIELIFQEIMKDNDNEQIKEKQENTNMNQIKEQKQENFEQIQNLLKSKMNGSADYEKLIINKLIQLVCDIQEDKQNKQLIAQMMQILINQKNSNFNLNLEDLKKIIEQINERQEFKNQSKSSCIKNGKLKSQQKKETY